MFLLLPSSLDFPPLSLVKLSGELKSLGFLFALCKILTKVQVKKYFKLCPCIIPMHYLAKFGVLLVRFKHYPRELLSVSILMKG